MPTIQQAIETATTGPVFGGRHGLFVVSEGSFRELVAAGLPEDARLRERGYKSAVINGVPVIYGAWYTGNDYLAFEQELIGVLANNQQEMAQGVDAMTLLALTDGEESWYGANIDKTKYRIILEDETEDDVYLKIVKKQTGEGMRKLLFTLTFVIAFAASAFAQDRIKLSASYLNTEFQANPLENIEYLKGVSVDADARIFSRDGFRLGGVFNYQKVYNQEVFHDYLGTGIDIYRDVNTYAVGVQLSYRAGPVEPFGAFLLGARKQHEALEYEVVRKYRAGLDVPFTKESNFFVRPFFVEFEVTGGFNGNRTHKYGAGAGFRF